MSSGALVAIFLAATLGYLALLSSASERAKPKPPPPGCDFCRDSGRIIVYRESAYKELKVADFCPVCGRRLTKPPEDKK